MSRRSRRMVSRTSSIPIDEIDDVRAVRSGEATDGAELPAELASMAEQVHALHRAGWTMVAAEKAAKRGEGAEGARVFVQDGERVVLSSGAVLVKFRADVSTDDAERILRESGMRIVARVPVARNLFRAAPTSDRDPDALALAERLDACDEVEFAEPELVEVLPTR